MWLNPGDKNSAVWLETTCIRRERVTYRINHAPPLTSLDPFAATLLGARGENPDSTLADIYDPDPMPTRLRRAHQRLVPAVDWLYQRTPFAPERERDERLFALYERMRTALNAELQLERKRPARRRGAARGADATRGLKT